VFFWTIVLISDHARLIPPVDIIGEMAYPAGSLTMFFQVQSSFCLIATQTCSLAELTYDDRLCAVHR